MCAGVKDPPFVAEFLEEIRGPIELDEDPRISTVTDMQAWVAMANAVPLGR